MNNHMPPQSPDAFNPFDEIRRLMMSDAHLSQSTLSAYINFSDHLTHDEHRWVESHLSQCESCAGLFQNVFDDEMEFDVGVLERDCRVSADPSGAIRFETHDQSIQGIVDSSQVRFFALPDGIHKLQLAVDSSVRLRLSHARCNVPYLIAGSSANPPLTISIRHTLLNRARLIHFPNAVRYAAAAILILGTSLAVWLITRNPSLPIAEKPPVITTDSLAISTQKDSTAKDRQPAKKVESNNQLAFAPNPNLEAFVSRNYRSLPVQFTRPADGTDVGPNVVFEWNSDDSVKVAITVVDNANREIWRGESAAAKMELPVQFQPGLYYWFARIDDDIAHVAKFRVLRSHQNK